MYIYATPHDIRAYCLYFMCCMWYNAQVIYFVTRMGRWKIKKKEKKCTELEKYSGQTKQTKPFISCGRQPRKGLYPMFI